MSFAHFLLYFRLLITFANSLDPDQARAGSKLFDTLVVFLNECFEKVDFEKLEYLQQTTIKHEKYPTVKVTGWIHFS